MERELNDLVLNHLVPNHMVLNHMVLREDFGRIVVVTLNRPERHNSLVPELLEKLLETIEAIGSNENLRAMVLQANGPNFSTGGDALGFVNHLDGIESYSRNLVGLLNRMILALFDLRIPVIAAVQGMVTGGSMGLVLASDVVLAAREASFRPYYSVVGISPDGGWTALLPSIIGRQRTASVLMQNQTISADQALIWGIASQVVPSEDLRKEAMDLAAIIVENKPGSIYHTKRLLNLDRASLEIRLEAELEHFVQLIVTEEGREGFVTFLRELRTGSPEIRTVP